MQANLGNKFFLQALEGSNQDHRNQKEHLNNFLVFWLVDVVTQDWSNNVEMVLKDNDFYIVSQSFLNKNH